MTSGYDVVPGPDEQADELHSLVGGDPAGDPEQDARHAPHCARQARTRGASCGYAYLIFPCAISSMAIVR